MSNFRSKAFNPASKRVEDAEYCDDYYGRHRYGIRFDDGCVYPEAQCGIDAAATQLDALLKERDVLQTLAKELSDALLAVRPLGGSELFIRRFGQNYADPVYCKTAIEQIHEDRHEAQKGLIRYRRQAEKAEQERDALQARVKELEFDIAGFRLINVLHKNSTDDAESRAAALQARVKELEDGWDVYDTHTRLWKIEHDRKLEAAESRAARLQQERDEVYERAEKEAGGFYNENSEDEYDDGFNRAVVMICEAIRRLAGTEKIAAASDGEDPPPAGTGG